MMLSRYTAVFHSIASVLILLALTYYVPDKFSMSISVTCLGYLYLNTHPFCRTKALESTTFASTVAALNLVLPLVMMSQATAVLTGWAVSKELTLTQLLTQTQYSYLIMGSTFSACAAMLFAATGMFIEYEAPFSAVHHTSLGLCTLSFIAILVLTIGTRYVHSATPVDYSASILSAMCLLLLLFKNDVAIVVSKNAPA